jgi:hypothetical protein
MSRPIRIASEPRSFAPKPVLKTDASKDLVASEDVEKTPWLLLYGDLRRNPATPRKLDDH